MVLPHWITRRRLLVAIPFFALLVAAGAALLLWYDLPDVSPLKERRTSLTISVRDWKGREHPFVVGPANRSWVALNALPAELKWAVIVAEDANFYGHEGVDVDALKEALRYDLEQKRMARGASTITQQLAKNLYLSREKSLLRKGRELIIARRLEAELKKGRILELYLNLVELGPLVHGVGAGARYHFGKPVGTLSPAECAFLAAILPGPRVAYNPKLKPEKVRRRAAHILHLLQLRGVLSAAQEEAARRELYGEAPPPASDEENEEPTRDEDVPAAAPDAALAPESAPTAAPTEVPPAPPAAATPTEFPATVQPEELPAPAIPPQPPAPAPVPESSN